MSSSTTVGVESGALGRSAANYRRAAFVAALLGASALVACGETKEASGDQRPLSAAAPIFAAKMCAICHPIDGRDSMAGPGLAGIDAIWTEQALTDFLLDPPAALAKDARLNELAARYPTPMAKPLDLSRADANLLARWLLAERPK